MEELATLAADLAAIPSHDGEREAGSFVESWLHDETDALERCYRIYREAAEPWP